MRATDRAAHPVDLAPRAAAASRKQLGSGPFAGAARLGAGPAATIARHARRQPNPQSRGGMALIVVLVVIAALVFAALTFAELMLMEDAGGRFAVRRAQVRLAAESAVDMLRAFLATDEQSQVDAGGWYDNQQRFLGQLVVDGTLARNRCRFSVVSPKYEDGYAVGVRYGLEDESGKINLNTLIAMEEASEGVGRGLLMALPGMDEYTADAILDWLDADDEPRQFGAESEYYGTLDTPYQPRNGPLETLEELLLVRDVTPWRLFGADMNRNGLLDAGEPDPASIAELDNSEGTMDCGWAPYLTLWSAGLNLRSDGQPKIDVNQDDMETLYQELETVFGAQWATFIVAYRQQQKPYEEQEQQEGENNNEQGRREGGNNNQQLEKETEPSGQLDLSQPGRLKLQSVLDLIGQQVKVKYQDQEREKVLISPFSEEPDAMSSYLPELMDVLTTEKATVLPGRININQAPRAVLEAIPGMTSEIVDQILSARAADPTTAPAEHRQPTWILCEGIVTLEQMKEILPLVCGAGAYLRAQVVGLYDDGGPFSRLEVVLDSSKQPAAIVFWRDVGHLGPGYSLDVLGAQP